MQFPAADRPEGRGNAAGSEAARGQAPRWPRSLLRPLLACWLLAAGLLGAGAHAAAPPVKLTILTYHEISERSDSLVPGYSVPPHEFAQEIAWLKSQGFNFVSMDQVLADAKHRRRLPEKAVLITFDDGYHSVYTTAFPILKAYHAPAVVALVGAWLEKSHGMIDFDGRSVPRTDLLSWEELRTMDKSGLIEIASHSHSLHQGILANPQGNLQPAATSRQWLAASDRYEDEAAYKLRIKNDLKRNSDLIKAHVGKRPRIIVWPYGRYNLEARTVAAELGMPIGLTLDDGPNTAETPLWGLRRVLVQPGMAVARLDRAIQLRNHNVTDDGEPVKVMHVNLDFIYDPDPKQQEVNLGHLLDRISQMGVNTVYLQAFADPDGTGSAASVYFPNRHLRVRADLFNRAAWQIVTRTSVTRLYASMPMLAWRLPASDPAAADTVVTEPNAARHVAISRVRLSPFSPRARKAIREIYQDLGRAATLDGVLFSEDASLSEDEDASHWARETYRQWRLPQPVAELRNREDLLQRWSELKMDYLDKFAAELAGLVREEQPDLKTARSLYPTVALDPRAVLWYAQSLDRSLANFDYIVVMAVPNAEQAADSAGFLRDLVGKVAERPGAMAKVVFELPSVRWRRDEEPIPGTQLAETIRTLYGWGARNVGYFPDNPSENNPDPALMRMVFHLKPNAPPLSDLLH